MPAAAPPLVIVNAAAGGHGHLQLVWRALRRLLLDGVRVEVVFTRDVGELDTHWPRDPGRRVILAGGDGTVHAAANLSGPLPEIALLPSGTANNIAMSLGIPVEPEAAAQLAVNGTAGGVNLIRASSPDSTRLVVEGVSVGYLAEARAHYHAQSSGDRAAAVAAGAAALVHFHPIEVDIETVNGPSRLPVSQLFVSNLARYGPRLHVDPESDPSDGLLEVITLPAHGRHSVPGMLRQLRSGDHIGRPGVRVIRTPAVTVRVPAGCAVVADSWDLGPGPIRLEAVHRALSVVMPAR